MEWPAQSPDLNPIELVWDELDRRVKAKQPTSATHLWELLQQCWEELSEQYLISIEERMPRVYSGVLSAIVYLFYAIISEYIETLNCLNFSKNRKNGGVLKLLTSRVIPLSPEAFSSQYYLLLREQPNRTLPNGCFHYFAVCKSHTTHFITHRNNAIITPLKRQLVSSCDFSRDSQFAQR